jgi:hypothetical protein
MSKPENPPAFPIIGAAGAPEDYPGMTMRDYFAAKAMQGLIASDANDGTFLSNALDAYQYADMMLKAREMK